MPGGRVLLVAAAFVVLDVAPVPGGSSCEGGGREPSPAPPRPSVAFVEVGPPQADVAVGESLQLTAWATWQDGSVEDVTDLASWTSSDPAVLSVAQGGLATGLGVGDVRVSAVYLDAQGATDVSVSVGTGTLIGCTVEPPAPVLAVGESLQLAVIERREGVPARDVVGRVELESSDPEVVQVDTDGLVTGLAVGRAEVASAIEGLACRSSRVDVQP